MLIFLLEEKSQECMTKVFDWLTEELGMEILQNLFPIILTENGTEFQAPARLECDENGEIRLVIPRGNPWKDIANQRLRFL